MPKGSGQKRRRKGTGDAKGPPGTPIEEMKRQMVAMRKAAGYTQKEMAELLGTKKSNISRLENPESSASPRLSTIQAYARALGYKLAIVFEPDS